MDELAEAADNKSLTKTINRDGRVDLLIIDELGYLSLDTRGAELLFQVLTEREEKNSIAIASNESSWLDQTFTDPRLCAAIVDRRTYGGTISRPAPPATASATPPSLADAGDRHDQGMSERDRPTEQQVAALDGAVAELIHRDMVTGWVAIQTEPFRNLTFAKHLGCWLLFTWADGTIDIEEDYPPYALVPELLSGGFTDEDRATNYEVRWAPADRRDDLWQRYGIHEPAGHYMGLAAKQRRDRR